MSIPRDIPGRIINSDKPGHRVKVTDDAEDTGGFLILEWWDEPSDSRQSATFDSWVADESALQAFFSETGWQVDWQGALGHVRGDAGTVAVSSEKFYSRSWEPISVNELEALVANQLNECSQAQRTCFGTYRVMPYAVPFQRRYGLEHVLVVAHLPNGLLYFEDVEEGFELGELDTNGVLHDNGCNQLSLPEALARLGLGDSD